MNIFVRTSALVLALCGAGCSLPTASKRAQQVYRLQPVAAEARPAERSPRSVVIHLLPVAAAPGLGSSAMLYSEGAGDGAPNAGGASPGEGAQSPVRPGLALMPYRDSRWLAPPAQLIGAAIAQTLSRQPWVSAVETNVRLAPPAWALHCELGRLEHDIDGTRGVVRLELTCQLAGDEPRGIVAHWRFDQWQAVTTNDAPHYAAAAQNLLDRALRDIVRRVRAHVLSGGRH